VAIRPDAVPGYPADWGDDPTVMQQRTVDTPVGPLTVATMPGIFSWQHLDDGTAFLLDNLEIEPGQTVLDVGCGYGIIGLVAAQRASHVTMTDDNLLAIRCARAAVAINHLGNADVQPGDVYAGLQGRQFELIVSNPPFHKEFDVSTNVAHRIMRDAKRLLRPGGRLVIVANAFLKYEAVMTQYLTKARVLARNNRYVVIEGRR
jgi:16S rRNA (guanine1207-N2)-methyltransferase